jgi:hypothetical protein
MTSTTSTLSISSTNIASCLAVTNALHKAGIECSVTENNSVIYDKKINKFIVETGCNIILTNTKVKHIGNTVWKPLQNLFGLDCGYLNIHGGYKGCILDFIRPSNCPGSL